MPFLNVLGVLTGTRFGTGTEHAEFLVETGTNGPVVRVISHTQRTNVTLNVADGAVATEGAAVDHRGARVPLTVDGWIGSITPLALTAAREGADEGRSVTAFLSTALPTETQMVELLAVTLADGTSWLYAARPVGTGIGVYQLNPTGDPVAQPHEADTSVDYLAGVRALTSARMGNVTFVIAGSQAENGITVLRVGANGALTPVDSLGVGQLVPVNDVMGLRTVVLDGRTFVIAASAGSSSLTVFELDAQGQLTVTDHLVDSLGTRFQGVQVFEVITVGDRVFVLAAGADDGLTLFTLLPDGELLLLQTLEDTAAIGLSNITALTAVEVGGSIQILAISGAEAGVTVLELDLAALGDVVQGGTGTLNGTDRNDMMRGAETVSALIGGAGDDVLIDGAGSQDMTGGAGADVFVFSGFTSGEVDRITDFADGVDVMRMVGVPGGSNAARFAQLSVTAGTQGGVGGTFISHDGHRIFLEGITPGQIDVNDFVFL